jgi:hypothetical protein
MKICSWLMMSAVLMMTLVLATGCGKTNENVPEFEPVVNNGAPRVLYSQAIISPFVSRNVVEIGERLFIGQVNDVYLNPDDYYGKTIKLEGIFTMSPDPDNPYCYVFRYGDACCDFGFEVAWPREHELPYPDDYAWVQATGQLRSYKYGIYEQLYLELSSLTELSKRGKEIVLQ